MQFSTAFLAATAFALTNAAAIITNSPAFFQTIVAGNTYNVTYSGATSSVTLLLKNGDPTALKTVSTIGTGPSGSGSILFTPSTSLTNTLYAFEIDDGTSINYSVQFTLSGGVASSASAGSTASSTSAPASTSASSASSAPTTAATTTASSTGNSTSTATSASKSASSSGSKASTAPTSTSTTPNTNSASSFASPLAFVFLAFAAMLTLN